MQEWEIVSTVQEANGGKTKRNGRLANIGEQISASSRKRLELRLHQSRRGGIRY